jgi:diadenylate cyclase
VDVINLIINTVKHINITSILDIIVVSYIFYKIYMLMNETRAEQLLKGILLIILLIPIAVYFT